MAGSDAAACVPPPDAAPPDAGAAPATCAAGGIPGSCLEVAACYGSRTPTAGACAGSAGIECCTPRFADGVTCDPNAMPQPNACLVEEPGDAGLPGRDGAGRGDAAFCVDRFEGALVDAATGAPWSPYFPPPASGGVRAVSLRGAVPQAYISQTQASAACAAAGKRLCRDAEWLRACGGPAMTPVPVRQDARARHVQRRARRAPGRRALRHERQLDLLAPRQPVPEPGGRRRSIAPARSPAASPPRACST